MFSPCIRTESKDDKHFIETTACHLYPFFPLSLSLALQSHFNEEDVRLADQGSDPNLTAVLRGSFVSVIKWLSAYKPGP